MSIVKHICDSSRK